MHQSIENLDLGLEHPVTILDKDIISISRPPLTDDSYSPTPERIHQDGTELVGLRDKSAAQLLYGPVLF